MSAASELWNSTWNRNISVNTTIAATNISSVKDQGGPGTVIITIYVSIFFLAVSGNTLVLVTLAQNKRMRTVTNVYLLNLAVSDLLLGLFCVPFTLVGQVLRNFIFGALMCKLIPYFQAVSVSVGVWTLVAISLERYFAICRPLQSRRWQTQFHAYKMIACVWLASLSCNIPILFVSRLKAMRDGGKHKCRETWPTQLSEKLFNLFLDAILLLIPLIIMSLAYSLIVSKLWKGLQREIKHNSSCRRRLDAGSSATVGVVGGGSESAMANETASLTNNILSADRMLRQHRSPMPSVQHRTNAKFTSSSTDKKKDTVKLCFFKFRLHGIANSKQSPHLSMPLVDITNAPNDAVDKTEGSGQVCNHYSVSSEKESTYTFSRHAIRSNYMDKSIEAKKKVIRMLFVVVGEFFICWTPIHILNTVYLFNPEFFRTYLGNYLYLVQILAYVSSCCNPITYCFMNRKFRQAFLSIFKCYQCARICCFCGGTVVEGPLGPCSQLDEPGPSGQNNSELSGNDSTLYVGRGCRSEVVVLDGEERV